MASVPLSRETLPHPKNDESFLSGREKARDPPFFSENLLGKIGPLSLLADPA